MSESSNEITIAQPIVATPVETRRLRSLRRPAWVLSVIGLSTIMELKSVVVHSQILQRTFSRRVMGRATLLASPLFKWDRALYTDKLVRQSALSEAFTPGKVQQGTTVYGFGWNVVEEGGNKYVWHQGSQAGFRAFIERRLTERGTVIMLTNKGNSKRQEINAAIQNVMVVKPYVLPKQSGAEKLYKIIHDSGIQPALEAYDGLKNAKDAGYDLGENELNTLGYQLLYGDKRVRDSIAIFKLNAREYSMSSKRFRQLGRGVLRNGDKDLAINRYQTAVKLDPTNSHAAKMLKELK